MLSMENQYWSSIFHGPNYVDGASCHYNMEFCETRDFAGLSSKLNPNSCLPCSLSSLEEVVPQRSRKCRCPWQGRAWAWALMTPFKQSTSMWSTKIFKSPWLETRKSNTKAVPMNFLLKAIDKWAVGPLSHKAGVFQFASLVRELFEFPWTTLGHAEGQTP